MQSDNTTYLVYDKYCGDHAFDNKYTKDIIVSQLFSSDYQYLEGNPAIKKFNEYGGMYTIPEDLDLALYTPYLFTVPIKTDKKTNVNATITIVAVDTILLKEMEQTNNISNKDFLINLCSFHLRYDYHTKAKGTNTYTDTNTLINKIAHEIVTDAIKPNADVTDPMIGDPEYTKDTHKMFNYQKRTVHWLIDKEINSKPVHFNFNDEIILGSIVYDSVKKTLIPIENRKSINFSGGALIDEVGLGKTYQMIVLSLSNPATDVSYITSGCKRLNSRATLVICPNQLCGQWIREIEKMIKDNYKTTTIPLLTKNHYDKYSYLDLLDADFVIVSYNFLGNTCYLNKWMSKMSKSKSYHKSSLFDIAQAEKIFDDMAKDIIENPSKLTDFCPTLNLIKWHRVIVDEFHEIFTVEKYSYMKNIIRLFEATYKWCVSGTPFDKGSGSLIKMIDFTTNYTNTFGDQLLLSPNIKQHMLKNFFRRNTKKSVMDEYTLLPLKEHIIWLKFSQTERMMYNAYLVDPNVNKFSVLMRKICCHPKLADEIKSTLSNCKTLEDIEKSMIGHYERAKDAAEKRVKFIEYRIRKTERKIKLAQFRRQRRLLKQQGYRTRLDFPKENKDEDKQFEKMDEIEDMPADVPIADIDSDDEESTDDGRPLFIVSINNWDKAMKLIGKQYNANLPQIFTDLNTTLRGWQDKLAIAKKEFDGKKVTYEFFSNMMDRVRKTLSKEKKDDDSDDDSDGEYDEDEEICGICMCEIDNNDVGVTKCGHIYCFQCLKAMIEKTRKCPMCSKSVASNEMFMISYEKKNQDTTDQNIVDKNSLINQVGTKLANLIYYIKSTNEKCIIFSQWDDLLKQVGDVLDTYGIKNIFCRGNVWQRDKAIREFSTQPDMRIIMLSSESAASGTNLTAATTVILLDPVYGTYEYRMNTEWQAIGRAYRMGQTKQVNVVRFIIKNTVEEEIYELNKAEDSKHNHKINLFESSDDKIVLSQDKVGEIAKSVEASKLKKKEKEAKKVQTKTSKSVAVKAEKKVIKDDLFDSDDGKD